MCADGLYVRAAARTHGPIQDFLARDQLSAWPWAAASARHKTPDSFVILEVFVSPSQQPGPLFTVRSALILFLGFTCGALAAFLSYLGGRSAPASGLVGGGAFAAAVVFFNAIIGS